MAENHFAKLYGLVRQALATRERSDVHADILAAHLYDRPRGFITRDSSGLVRQYRNNVSCDPAHLIKAALAYEEEVTA